MSGVSDLGEARYHAERLCQSLGVGTWRNNGTGVEREPVPIVAAPRSLLTPGATPATSPYAGVFNHTPTRPSTGEGIPLGKSRRYPRHTNVL